jgi:hypothetical protein
MKSECGKSLYLIVTKHMVKWSTPRDELSNPGVDYWKAIERIVGYIKDNEVNIPKPSEL